MGRCADYVLEGRENLVRLFIYADHETCVKKCHGDVRLAEKGCPAHHRKKTDKNRSTYYRYYTGRDWQDAGNYDLCINTSPLGYERSVQVVRDYLKTKRPAGIKKSAYALFLCRYSNRKISLVKILIA